MTILSQEGDRLVIRVASLQDTADFAAALAPLIAPGTVIGLIGPLGAGKTTLVRDLARSLGADPATVNSPTFVLIQEYAARLPIYHFDTYRLADPEAFDDLGADEMLLGDGLCLVEWADRVLGRLPRGSWMIRMSEHDGARIFEIEMEGASLAKLARELEGPRPEISKS